MYAIIPVILFIVVFSTLYIFVYQFAKNYPSQRAFENGFWVLLAIAVLNSYFILCFLLSLREIGGDVVTYYRMLFSTLFDGAEYRGVEKTLFLFSAFLVHLGGVIIPALTIFYLRFSSWLSILSISRRTKNFGEAMIARSTIEEMESLFYDVKQSANITYPVEFLLLDRDKGFDVSWGCQIIKGRNKIFLIIDENLLECFESGKINRDEIKAIFSHEINHIYHKDYFLPLLAKYLIYTAMPLPIVLTYSLAFLFSAIIKFDGIYVLWTKFLGPSLVFFLVTYCVRIVLLQIVGYTMRQREYLADAQACEGGVTPEIMSGVLKKTQLLFMPKIKFFKAFSFSSGSLPSIDSQTRIDPSLRFLGGEVLMHPLTSDRIKAIKEAKYFLNAKKIEPLPLGEVVISTLLLTVFSLIIGSSFNIFQKTSVGGFPVLFLILTTLLVPIIISMLSCLPLRFWDARTLEIAFIPGTPGSQSQTRAFLLFVSLFYNKHWLKIHRNNFVAVLIVWFLTANFLSTDFAQGLALLLPLSLVGCTGICVLYIINCINAKYREEKGITPIIK